MFRQPVWGAAVVVWTALTASVTAQNAVTAQSDPVKLERRWPEGETRTTEATLKLDQVMTIQGMEIETRIEQATTTRQLIGKRRDDGSIPVSTKIDAFKATMTLPGGLIVAFDSANPDAKADDPMLQPILDALKTSAGVEYTFVVGKDGSITAIEGLEAVREKFEASNPETVDLLKDRFQPDAMKKAISDELNILPETLVRPGDSWTRTQTQQLGMGQTLSFETRYTYQGTVEKAGKTLDRITVKSTNVKYAQDPNAGGPARVVGSDLKIESSDGEILFDRAAGQEVETRQSTRMVGPLTLDIMGQQLDVELDLTVESISQVK
ncbi:MAG: hypothetical protein KatS3mg108_0382 [Isosphaeraceae bacterium]|nr:MAG: hypothetical protein KatS3mg108_0382 [Isosphaeraceae bacterium]